MLSVVLIKIVLDEYIGDISVNLDMVWKRANSKTWKISANGGTSYCKTHIFLYVKAVTKRKIISISADKAAR